MQNIEKILKIDGSAATWADKWGKSIAAPDIMVGVKYTLLLDLRSVNTDEESGELLPVAQDEFNADSFYIALDADYDQTTIPKLLKTDGITLSSTEDGRALLAVELPETAVPELVDALEKRGSVSFHGEIGGFEVNDGATAAGFAFQFELTVRNRVWLGGEVPEEVAGNPEYLTAAEVRALIADATRPEKGDKGDPGDSAYDIAVAGGYSGTQEEWLASLKGLPGDDGDSAYDIAVAGGYSGTQEEWLASLKGLPGDSAYDIAVAGGYSGTQAEWLASLKGEDGEGLHYDASGELSELETYADAPAGFVFLATETDSKNKTSYLYLYKKRSADYGDWFDPAVIAFFKQEYKITSLEPIVFSAPEEADSDYLMLNISDYPNATVSAVCIDTAEGELLLPFGSASGIRKLVKTTENKLLIYFGAQCPEYETGKIYLSQFLGSVEAGESQITAEQMFLGYIPADVLGNCYRVSDITETMLQDSRSQIFQMNVSTQEKTTLGVVPAGAVVVVLIPDGYLLCAKKFDGFGGFVEFIEDNVEQGTGENGGEYMMNGKTYKIFGEFVLATAEISVGISKEG